MKKIWLALLVFLFWTIIMLLFHHFFAKNPLSEHENSTDQPSKKQSAELASTTPTEPNFFIAAEDGSIYYQFADAIKTNRINGDLEIPENVLSFKDSIYQYLNKNQDKEVSIGVKYLTSEIDSSKSSHLGQVRATRLKNILIGAGVNPDRLYFELIPANYSYDENGEFDSGISMRFKTISDEHNQQIEAGIRNKTLYADFAQAEFKPDKTLMAYTLELKNYLAKYSGRSIVVTGHTDSVGVNNYQWGLDRANNVKNYLIAQGITPSIIEVVSQGERQPIASNLTEEGRAKNRRIVITVK